VRHPAPATALHPHWPDLARPLEAYRSPAVDPNPEDWSRDFRLEVEAVIEAWKAPRIPTPQPLSDEQRERWGLPEQDSSNEPARLDKLISSLAGQDPDLALHILPLWRYVRTANRSDGAAPTSGNMRDGLRQIEAQAARLVALITNLVGGHGRPLDPWLDAQIDAEVTGDGKTWPPPVVAAFAAVPAARKELHYQNPHETPLEEPSGAATESFIHLAMILRRLRDFATYGSLAATRGLAAMERTPGGRRGAPGKQRARLLARLLLSRATRYAPARGARQGDREAAEWCNAVAQFVHAVASAADLPTVNVKELAAMLRKPDAAHPAVHEPNANIPPSVAP
jgi:hypothetical protein